jgi:hypothetical protein
MPHKVWIWETKYYLDRGWTVQTKSMQIYGFWEWFKSNVRPTVFYEWQSVGDPRPRH